VNTTDVESPEKTMTRRWAPLMKAGRALFADVVIEEILNMEIIDILSVAHKPLDEQWHEIIDEYK